MLKGWSNCQRFAVLVCTVTGWLAVPPAPAGGTPSGDYGAWLCLHFPQSYPQPSLESSTWGDLADPDGDGCVNLIEFITARDPKVRDPELAPRCWMDGDDLVITYRETIAAAPGVTWSGEWTGDLTFWVLAGIRYRTVESHVAYRLIEARISRGREQKIWFRLSAAR